MSPPLCDPSGRASLQPFRLRTDPRPGPNATDPQAGPAAITWRPILIGFLIVLIFCPYVVYSYTVTQTTDLASDHSAIAAVFFLVLLIGLGNVIWIKMLRGKGLNSSELLIVYIMLIMPSAVATLGVSESLIPMLVAPVYQKSAGDRYVKVVTKHLDNDLLVMDREAAQEFMERRPRSRGSRCCWGTASLRSSTSSCSASRIS